MNCVIDYVEEKNSLLFIDLTYMRSSEENVKELTRLLLCNSPSIAIALSSGGGRDFEQNYIASIVDVRLKSFKAICFKPFNEQEATAFIETFTTDHASIVDNRQLQLVRMKFYTGLNPYLLYAAFMKSNYIEAIDNVKKIQRLFLKSI